jgi:hypothetical protein
VPDFEGLSNDDAALRERMTAIARERRRFGYRRIHVRSTIRSCSGYTSYGFIESFNGRLWKVNERGFQDSTSANSDCNFTIEVVISFLGSCSSIRLNVASACPIIWSIL